MILVNGCNPFSLFVFEIISVESDNHKKAKNIYVTQDPDMFFFSVDTINLMTDIQNP